MTYRIYYSFKRYSDQLNLGLPGRALRLVEASLPAVLSHGTLQEQGRALLLLASCHIAMTDKQGKPFLQQSIPVLCQALELFKKAKDFVRTKHSHYILALVYNKLGLISDRNKCAYEFRLLIDDFPTPPGLVNSF